MISFKSFTGLQYHKKLNPKLWDHNDMLKPHIRIHLIMIGKLWQEFAKIPDDAVVDYTITGGNAALNFTPLSDIDLHIKVDYSKMPIKNVELLQDYIKAKKDLWAIKHPNITVEGYPVELYAQSIEEVTPKGQSVYSLTNNDWIFKPVYLGIKFNGSDLKQDVYAYVQAIKSVIEAGDLEKAKNIKNQITQERGPALQQDGEFAEKNEVFKALRNSGFLQRLADFTQQAEDRKLSYGKFK